MKLRSIILRIVAGVFLLAVLSMSAGCEKKMYPTAMAVDDSIRHYYPIVAGEKLQFSFLVRNIGDSPLLLDDVQPSCGCIMGKLNANIIPPHDTLTLSFTFDSSKNVGYVRHAIRIYGNILPRGMATLIFDVNVVPPSDHDPDYEEVYQEKRVAEGAIEGLVDGKPSEKGYYVDPADRTDSCSHAKYPWRE